MRHLCIATKKSSLLIPTTPSRSLVLLVNSFYIIRSRAVTHFAADVKLYWLMQPRINGRVIHLLRATAVPAGTAERVLATAILSVCPSVCPGVRSRYRFMRRSDKDTGFLPYGSLESLVSNELIWCRWVSRFPSNESIK